MAWTQTDVDALEAAIASGTLSVQYQDRKVVYHSLADMLELRRVMRAEVQAASSSAPDRHSRVRFPRK